MDTNKPYIESKWPGLLVVGDKVTKDQAKEIIIRTTRWPLSSNNNKADETFNNLISPPKEFNKGLSRIKPLNLTYLNNERITNCYIGGSKGWIDWNGIIFANSWNIGKWPSINEVTEDWKMVAQAFPFLNLRSQVLDVEISQENPIPTAEWTIKNGKVEVQFPEKLLCEIEKYEDEPYSIFVAGLYAKRTEVFATVEDVKKGIELAKINN